MTWGNIDDKVTINKSDYLYFSKQTQQSVSETYPFSFMEWQM